MGDGLFNQSALSKETFLPSTQPSRTVISMPTQAATPAASPMTLWVNKPSFEGIPQDSDNFRDELNSTLSSAMLTRNLLVLTGSGPSIAVGGPKMAELWSAVAAAEGFAGVKALVNYDAKAGEAKEDIEYFLTLCRLYEALEVNAANLKTVSDFVEKAENIIAAKCRDFVREDNAEKLEPYRMLLERTVRRRNDWPRVKLFTTNYDLCLERAADSVAMPYIDGFSMSYPRTFGGRWFDVDFVRRNVDHGTPSYLENVFYLHKLHGSVDWERTTQGVIRKESTTTPCLIYPRSEKYALSYDQPYLEMMSRFQSALREPDTCLVVIGFGFNDHHLNQMIMNALRINSAFKLVIYDNDITSKITSANAHSEWQKLDQIRREGASVSFIQSSFELFAKSLPPFSDARKESDLAVRIAKLLEAKPSPTTPSA
jgi:hypothetical protein